MKFELVVTWSTGDIDVYEYSDRDQAEKAAEGMRTALGNQIRYTCIRRKV